MCYANAKLNGAQERGLRVAHREKVQPGILDMLCVLSHVCVTVYTELLLLLFYFQRGTICPHNHLLPLYPWIS